MQQPSAGQPRASVPAVTSRAVLVWRRMRRQPLAMAGLAIVALLFAMAYLMPHFIPWRYDQLDTRAFLSPPSAAHWFGTTQNGFDMLALTLRGMQKSLVIGVLGALVATGLAAVVGAFAAYFGGWLNTVLVGVVDLLLVLPAFLIIAILSPVFQGRTWLIFVLLLAAFQWMITARIVRGLTLSLKEREFVHAARFMGVPGWRIIFRHILPNMASLLIVDATVNVSSLILAEVGLSFFGFGVQPPDVSLGTLIGDYSGAALTFPWEFYFPAGFLVALVLSVNLVGDGLRDALDPDAGAGRGT
ncbi:MAG TPA: ABC transporter permease [Steroidobacteraceae bacterium]|nr:ABC transporter permease [Steroidobacteraceae bacterium]